MKIKKIAIIVVAIAIAFAAHNTFLLGEYNSGSPEGYKIVTKVIDGDTVIIEGGVTIRLLGIDADERDYPCYEPAKKRLEELVLNKKVYLEADAEDQDQYRRYLRYLILDGDNICVRLVREGLSVARFNPTNIKYRDVITAAEKEAIDNKVGCKWGEGPKKAQEERAEPSEAVRSGAAILAQDAVNYYGKKKTVEGRIVDGFISKTGTVFLNFERSYPNHCFTAVIFASSLAKFPKDPDSYYSGKVVQVTGKIKEYNGKPEIILNDPSQIEIIRE